MNVDREHRSAKPTCFICDAAVTEICQNVERDKEIDKLYATLPTSERLSRARTKAERKAEEETFSQRLNETNTLQNVGENGAGSDASIGSGDASLSFNRTIANDDFTGDDEFNEFSWGNGHMSPTFFSGSMRIWQGGSGYDSGESFNDNQRENDSGIMGRDAHMPFSRPPMVIQHTFQHVYQTVHPGNNEDSDEGRERRYRIEHTQPRTGWSDPASRFSDLRREHEPEFERSWSNSYHQNRHEVQPVLPFHNASSTSFSAVTSNNNHPQARCYYPYPYYYGYPHPHMAQTQHLQHSMHPFPLYPMGTYGHLQESESRASMSMNDFFHNQRVSSPCYDSINMGSSDSSLHEHRQEHHPDDDVYLHEISFRRESSNGSEEENDENVNPAQNECDDLNCNCHRHHLCEFHRTRLQEEHHSNESIGSSNLSSTTRSYQLLPNSNASFHVIREPRVEARDDVESSDDSDDHIYNDSDRITFQISVPVHQMHEQIPRRISPPTGFMEMTSFR